MRMAVRPPPSLPPFVRCGLLPSFGSSKRASPSFSWQFWAVENIRQSRGLALMDQGAYHQYCFLYCARSGVFLDVCRFAFSLLPRVVPCSKAHSRSGRFRHHCLSKRVSSWRRLVVREGMLRSGFLAFRDTHSGVVLRREAGASLQRETSPFVRI